MKAILKGTLKILNIDPYTLKIYFIHARRYKSILYARRQQKLDEISHTLTNIEPDISQQENRGSDKFNSYWEIKRRTLQAFQCKLMLKVIEGFTKKELVVADTI